MRAFIRSYPFIVLLSLLLMATRISGAHWHLCFDGGEPAQAMHIGDIDLHENDGDRVHQDTDLKLVDDGFAKNLGKIFDAPLLTGFVLLLWLLPRNPRLTMIGRYLWPVYLSLVLPLHAPPRAPPL